MRAEVERLIREIDAEAAAFIKRSGPNASAPYLGAAVSALKCCRDNLTWHEEAEAKEPKIEQKAAKSAKEPATN